MKKKPLSNYKILYIVLAVVALALVCGYFLHKKTNTTSVKTYETTINSSCSTQSWSTEYWEDENGNIVRKDTPSAIRKEKTKYEMHCDCNATKKEIVFTKSFNINVEYDSIVDEIEPCGTYCNDLCEQKSQEYFDSIEQK